MVEELADGAVVVELPYGSSRLARPGGPQGRRRSRRARARRGARGRAQGRHRLTTPGVRGERSRARSAGSGPRCASRAGPSRDRPDRRPEPGADDARGHEHVPGRSDGPAYVIDPGPADQAISRPSAAAASARRDRRGPAHPLARGSLRRRRGAWRRAALGRSGPRRRGGGARAALAGSGRIEERALDDHGEPALADDELANVGPFEVLPTPGHATDHVCFAARRGRLLRRSDPRQRPRFVPPRLGGGSLGAYLDSLERLRALDLELLCPGHGPWIDAPRRRDRRVRRAPADP